jgi:heme A synthase
VPLPYNLAQTPRVTWWSRHRSDLTNQLSAAATSPAAPRTAAYLAAACAYLLIVVGGLVRATGSGLGCPDWPLCHGQPLPPALQAPIIEFSHRLLATLTTAVAVGASVLILRTQSFPGLRVLATAVPLLLLTLIGLGAVVVKLELPPHVVTIHLALALLLLGILTTEALLLTPPDQVDALHGISSPTSISGLATVAAVVVYLQALIGALVRASGASLACEGFPLCNGELLPLAGGPLVALQLLHRAGAIAVLGMLGALYFRASRQLPRTSIAFLAAGGFALAILQAAIGIFAVTSALPPVSQALHVAGAAAVWVATLATAVRAKTAPTLALFDVAGSR